MFPRAQRLSKKEIERVFRQGRGRSNRFLFVKRRENTLPYFRFAVVVGSAVSKQATERNRIRRRLSAFLERDRRASRGSSSYDIVIGVRAGARELSPRELRNNIQALLSS